MQIRNLAQAAGDGNSGRQYLTALIVLIAVFFFYGLGSLPLIGPDEPRYVEIARAMYESGDWITPRLAGVSWFEKPALTYWLSALGFLLFGVSEFAARFGVALMAGLGVVFIYYFGSRVKSLRFGYLCAASLVTCGLWPGFARGATFDMPLSVAMMLALGSFYLWDNRQSEKGGPMWWCIFSFALGLGVLAKGLIGLVLPVGIIGLYLVLTRRLRRVLRPGLLISGAIVFLATASIWYGPVIARHGREFIDEFFIAHHMQRYLSNKYRHPQPFYFFLLVVLAGSFPWSFYLVSQGWQTFRRWRESFTDQAGRLNLFLWLWIMTPVVFFSFSGSKLPGYILPVFPALALVIGLELEKWWTAGENRPQIFLIVSTTAVLIIAAVVLGLGGESLLGMNLFDSFRIAAILGVVGLIHLLLWFLLSGRASTLFLPFGLGLVMFTFVNIGFPVLGERESFRDPALAARGSARPDERLIFFVNYDHGINYYATGLPLRDERSDPVTVNNPKAILSWMDSNGAASMLVLSRREWSEGVSRGGLLRAEKIGEFKSGVSCSPQCDWELLRVSKNREVTN